MKGRALFSPCVPNDEFLEHVHPLNDTTFECHETLCFLHYKEEGLFYTPHTLSEFYREYMYGFYPKGAFSIYFAHNKRPQNLFMTFQEDHAQSSHHQCLSDHYEGEFQKIDENSFQLFYRVKGPRKDYTLKTLYERHSFD